MKLYHLDYRIDKKKYRKVFFDNYKHGRWHDSLPDEIYPEPRLCWWKLYCESGSWRKELVKEVEYDLNIIGLNNFPRFSYYTPHARLRLHLDEDNMCIILLNLNLDYKPKILLENADIEYESLFMHAGSILHGLNPIPEPRLILKFAIRHPWDEVYERLDKFSLINYK